jgi:hypothetical protein
VGNPRSPLSGAIPHPISIRSAPPPELALITHQNAKPERQIRSSAEANQALLRRFSILHAGDASVFS